MHRPWLTIHWSVSDAVSCDIDETHCVKSVQIRSFFWSVFSRIWTEYGQIRPHLPAKYLSVFSPNVGKYGPEKTPYLDTFHEVTLSISPYAGVFDSGDFKVHYKDWLTYSGGNHKPGQLCYYAPFLLYNNPFYKNHKAQNRRKIKNILRIMLRLKVSNLIGICAKFLTGCECGFHVSFSSTSIKTNFELLWFLCCFNLMFAIMIFLKESQKEEFRRMI